MESGRRVLVPAFGSSGSMRLALEFVGSGEVRGGGCGSPGALLGGTRGAQAPITASEAHKRTPGTRIMIERFMAHGYAVKGIRGISWKLHIP